MYHTRPYCNEWTIHTFELLLISVCSTYSIHTIIVVVVFTNCLQCLLQSVRYSISTRTISHFASGPYTCFHYWLVIIYARPYFWVCDSSCVFLYIHTILLNILCNAYKLLYITLLTLLVICGRISSNLSLYLCVYIMSSNQFGRFTEFRTILI